MEKLEELYPHLFMNNAKSIVSSMLKVDQEAAQIKQKAKTRFERDVNELTIEEQKAIAFQCIENSKKQEKERLKFEAAKRSQKKNLREFDPRIGIEERHTKINEKRQERIKNTAEEKLEELRRERQRLLDEISPGEMEKIRIEIKQTAEEVRRQDLANRKQLKEQQELEKIAKNKEILKIEMEKKQKELQDFKGNKMFKTLLGYSTVKRKTFLFWGFAKINAYAITLKTKCLKLLRKNRFKRILRYFHLWKAVAFKIKLEEEVAIFQAEQERVSYLLEIAQKNYEFWLKRKALESFAKYLYIIRREKKEQEEINIRRQKFENFMKFVKVRTEEEMERKEQEKLDLKKYEEKKELKKPEEKILLKDKTFEAKPEVESSEKFSVEDEVFSKVSLNSAKQDACTYTESENPEGLIETVPKEPEKSSSILKTPEIIKKTPKQSKEVLKMQQRQEERKLKREALEAKYKEKKDREEAAKKEQELKTLEEEKKKKREAFEKKKEAERLKKENEEKKKRDQEELNLKTEIAEDHYENFIMKTTLAKWVEFHYAWQRSLIKAEVFHDRAIKKYALGVFKAAFQIAKLERAAFQAKREENAFNYYLGVLKKSLFGRWKKKWEQRDEAFLSALRVRENYLKKTVFGGWREAVPDLLDERYEIEKMENMKIEKFRSNLVLPKVIKAWKEFVEERHEERLKEEYANSMWEKAQEWLAEARRSECND